jgi:hypothetical protein
MKISSDEPPLQWFYADETEKRGPFSSEEMGKLIQEQSIDAGSLVWNTALPSWQHLRNSSLSYLMNEGGGAGVAVISRSIPPPCTLPEVGKQGGVKRLGNLYRVLIITVLVVIAGVRFWLQRHPLSEVTTQTTGTPASRAAVSPLPVVAAPTSPEQTPTATATPMPVPSSTPAQVVSSSNPVIYSGYYINQSTGESGDLTLRVEHFISTGGSQVAFGGQLLMNNIPTSITGTYEPEALEVSFSPGVQSGVLWRGGINERTIKGTFTRQNYSGKEEGIWQVKHSDGGNFQKAENAR